MGPIRCWSKSPNSSLASRARAAVADAVERAVGLECQRPSPSRTSYWTPARSRRSPISHRARSPDRRDLAADPELTKDKVRDQGPGPGVGLDDRADVEFCRVSDCLRPGFRIREQPEPDTFLLRLDEHQHALERHFIQVQRARSCPRAIVAGSSRRSCSNSTPIRTRNQSVMPSCTSNASRWRTLSCRRPGFPRDRSRPICDAAGRSTRRSGSGTRSRRARDSRSLTSNWLIAGPACAVATARLASQQRDARDERPRSARSASFRRALFWCYDRPIGSKSSRLCREFFPQNLLVRQGAIRASQHCRHTRELRQSTDIAANCPRRSISIVRPS